ncbi:Uncharacterised protein [Candidatus Burarchaeum australiense]|nr:Uncharacterised protein [Candidatus Burarchaeum australiense]
MNLRLNGFSLSLDNAKCGDCYISHAHSDHAAAAGRKGKRLLASAETLALLGKEGREAVHAHDSVKLRLINAGHMLGSTQLVAESDEGKFVYTGDFKVEDGLTVKGAEVEACNYLLMESTYSSPSTAFPPREKVREELVRWVKKEAELNTVLIGGYSLGKAQELVATLNEGGLVPLVHPRIEQVCKIYSRFGVRLERIPLDSPEGEELKKKNFVGVMPFHLVDRELAYDVSRLCGKGVATALATGWANTFRYPVDKVFQLSDHADFGEMLDYLERAKPGKIWCCYGDSEYLARALCAKGYNASAFSEAAQRTLADEVGTGGAAVEVSAGKGIGVQV